MTGQRNHSIRRILCMLLLFSGILFLQGAAAKTVLAAPSVKEVEYGKGGKVEVEFTSRVAYKNLKVKVVDEKGKNIPVSVRKKGKDEIKFTASKARAGMVYTFTVSGIRKTSEKSYSTVSGSYYVPVVKGAVPVKSICYDAKDRELEFSFSGKVEWKSPKITITDNGRTISSKIRKAKKDELEIRTGKLQKGRVYQFRISGLRRKGSRKYGVVYGTFRA